jgi:hypothetical protein
MFTVKGMNMLEEHERPMKPMIGVGGYKYNGYPYGRGYGYVGVTVEGVARGEDYRYGGEASFERAIGGGGYEYDDDVFER